jgi:uncharacterized protein YndB with AHSA1/START domain
MARRGRATLTINRSPDAVFEALTDVHSLPNWNGSSPDDDNPSHTIWTWEVAGAGDGAAVTVRWELVPRTPTRRIAALVRRRMIPDEARASIRQLEDRC